MIKLIASDMDGTLLGKDHDISVENLKAIRKAQEMGVDFVIVTGRAYVDIKAFIEKHNLNCECIVLNGAEYRDKEGNILEKIYIDKDNVKNILKVIGGYGLTSEIYTDRGFYTTNTKDEILTGILNRLKAFNPEVKNYDKKMKEVKESIYYLSMNYITDIGEFLNSDIEISKFVAFHDSEGKITELKKKLENIEGIAISSTFRTNIEVNHIEAQKGTILAKAAKNMRLKKEEVMVLGDSFNDYSMFKEFPVSVAMGNAISEIKEAAKYVTDTNDRDGVAKAIYKALDCVERA